MAQPGKRGKPATKPLAEILPDMLAAALARQDDFILTHEIDPDTGKRRVYAMSGRFISGCMLRKLIGQAESQRDEGSVLVTRSLKPDRPAR